MTVALHLECFGSTAKKAETIIMTPSEIEELHQQTYQRGYRQGEEDAHAAHEAMQNAQRDAIIQHLNDLAFTYHEARQNLLKELSPLMRVISEKILPDMARHSLAPRIADLFMEKIRDGAECPVRICAPSAVLDGVRACLSGVDPLPVEYIVAEDGASTAALVSFAGQERKLDLGDLVARIDIALATCFAPERKAVSHE